MPEAPPQDLSHRILSGLGSERVVAHLPDGPLRSGDLRDQAARLSEALARGGVQRGARLLVVARSDRAVVIAVTACLGFGYGVMVCDPAMPEAELQALVGVFDPAALVGDGDSLHRAVPVAAPQPLTDDLYGVFRADAAPVSPQDGPGLFVHTSGTTSRPKIVALGHDALLAQLDSFRAVYGFDETARLSNPLPLHHVDGLIRGPVAALWFGATLLRHRPFSVAEGPALLADLAAERATHLITVPAMLRLLMRLDAFRTPGRFGPQFDFILCSADYLDAGLWSQAEAQFGVPVVNAYGLSEIVCDALFAGPDPATRQIGTIGRPVGVTARVLDNHGHPVPPGQAGELVLSGPTVMRGYFGDPDMTATVLRDGGFFTGDIVRARTDGLFEYLGRKKNVVVVGGVNVHPEHVAECLAGLDPVGESYAFGHGGDQGERLIAVVTPAEGHAIDMEAVWRGCREKLPAKAQPSEIVMVPALPRVASGKVDRAALIALALREQTDLGAEAGARKPSVLEIAARCFNVPVEELSEDSTPFDTAGWDSLAHVAFIEDLEETWNFTMSAEDIALMLSLGDAMDIVARETGQANG